MPRVTDHYHIARSQAELDFVDVPLDTDIKLFADPFAIQIIDDPWFIACTNLIVDFFSRFLTAIKDDKVGDAMALLSNLREPNETRLGLSEGLPQGRGIGSEKATQIYNRFRRSRAAKTGLLVDLQDAELLIPGISHDGISDITLNVIRSQLVTYTQAQARLHGIPLQRDVSIGACWSERAHRWESRYHELPVADGRPLLLVPKVGIRYQLAIDSSEFYRADVLSYLQAEYLQSGRSLITTLKSGKRVVYKKDVAEKHPMSKEFLADFIEEHPGVLREYKEKMRDVARECPSDEGIEGCHPEGKSLDVESLIAKLDAIRPGREQADDYHNAILGMLEAIFYPMLWYPRKEQELQEGRKRIDIVFSAIGTTGFFHRIAIYQKIVCPFVIFECKNYSSDIVNPEFDQLTGRFSDTRGRLGFIVCRALDDRKAALKRCRDALHDRRGYVMVLTDSDIKSLLHLRAAEDYEGINGYMDELLRELVM